MDIYCTKCGIKINRYISPKDIRRNKNFYCSVDCRNIQYRTDCIKSGLLIGARALLSSKWKHNIAVRARRARQYKDKGYKIICDCCGYVSKEFELIDKPCPKCSLIRLRLFLSLA